MSVAAPRKWLIWKLPLRRETKQLIYLPPGSEVLSIANQWGKPHIWFRFPVGDKESPTVPYVVSVAGTGFTVDDEDSSYIGTILETIDDTVYVWHYFIRPFKRAGEESGR